MWKDDFTLMGTTSFTSCWARQLPRVARKKNKVRENKVRERIRSGDFHILIENRDFRVGSGLYFRVRAVGISSRSWKSAGGADFEAYN